MSQEALHRLHRAKIGPKSTAGADETVDNTVRAVAAGLEAGWHNVESTVDVYILQVNAAGAAGPAVAADLSAVAEKLPANTQRTFYVADDKSDGYLVWTRAGGSNGTLRINRADEPRRGAWS